MNITKTIIDFKGEKKRKTEPFGEFSYINFKSILKLFLKGRLLKKDNIYFATDNLKNAKKAYDFLNKRIEFTDIDKMVQNIFLDNLESIIRMLYKGDKLKIVLFSEKKDERVYAILKKISNFIDVFYISTKDENFYEAVSHYSLSNYGIAVSNQNFKCDITIVLNCENELETYSDYVINLSQKNIYGNVLYDIVYKNIDINIKKCIFIPQNCTNFNLIWKKFEKTIDKIEK